MAPDLVLAVAIDVGVKAAALGLSLYPMARPGASHFAGKAMGFRAVAYPPFLVLIPVAWLLSGQPGPYPFLADVLLGVPFLVDAAANVFGWFAIKRFDIIPHLTGWFCLSTAFRLAIAPLAGERWIAFGLVLGFGAAVGAMAIATVLWPQAGTPSAPFGWA